MVNVISFCVYGERTKYLIGMKENIKFGQKYFKGWKIRVHYNNTVPEEYINEYIKMGAECIKCYNIGNDEMNWEGMVWRLLPLDDKNVDFWISRDADSRLDDRDKNLVEEWMNSNKTLHCIRDHHCHYHQIMGGMYGINNRLFHNRYKFDSVKKIINDLYIIHKEAKYNIDQLFLNNKLWNLLKDDVIAHISNGGRRVLDDDIEIPSAPNFIGKQYNL